jgi:hypothetical protein
MVSQSVTDNHKIDLSSNMRETRMNERLKTESAGRFFRKKFLIAILLFLCLSGSVLPFITGFSNSKIAAQAALTSDSGQSPVELVWEKSYGGAGDDRAFYAAKTGDSGYLLVGSTTSIFPGKTVGWMVRIDPDGNMLWNKTFPHVNGSEFRRVMKTEHGFLLVGNIFSLSGTSNGMIAQIDEEGNVKWNATIDELNDNKLLSSTKVEDGYVFVGFTYSSENGNSSALVVKTTHDGNIVWNRTYGRSGENAASAIVTAENNSCVIAGYTNSSENGVYDVWLFKIDKDGTPVWDRTYGGTESEKAIALAKAENGYLVVGEKHSPQTDDDALMIKTDLNGDILWQKTYGGADFDKPSDVISLSSGGYAIAGFTFSWGKGERDFWLFKIDESGNVLWSCTQGREQYEEAYYVDEVTESEFAMVGWTNSIGNGHYDFYAARIKVDINDVGFFQNPLFYGAAGFGIAAVASVFVAVLYFERRKRKKTDGDNVQ